jgi:hypothetical protein
VRLIRPKYLVALATAVVVYALVGFLILPRVVRSSILKTLDGALTTRASIERVHVNPFALSLTVEGFRIPDARGATAIACRKLYLRFNIFSPFFGAWTLDLLRVEKPSVNVAFLPDRTLSLMALLRPAPAGSQPAGAPPSLLVRHLRVSGGTVSYEDESRQPPFQKTLIPIEIELKDFTTRRAPSGSTTYTRTSRRTTRRRGPWCP